MQKIKLSPIPEPKSNDSRTIVESKSKESRKTSEAQLRAIKKYEEKNKRINCRIPLNIWEKIENSGESANSIIIKALTQYFSKKVDLDKLLNE